MIAVFDLWYKKKWEIFVRKRLIIGRFYAYKKFLSALRKAYKCGNPS
jgi:hypothetical protein